MPEREYVIICNRYQGVGGALLFWGKRTEDDAQGRSFGGYTSDLNTCELYTREEIENSAYKMPFFVARDNYRSYDDVAIRVKQLKALGREMRIIYR